MLRRIEYWVGLAVVVAVFSLLCYWWYREAEQVEHQRLEMICLLAQETAGTREHLFNLACGQDQLNHSLICSLNVETLEVLTGGRKKSFLEKLDLQVCQ